MKIKWKGMDGCLCKNLPMCTLPLQGWCGAVVHWLDPQYVNDKWKSLPGRCCVHCGTNNDTHFPQEGSFACQSLPKHCGEGTSIEFCFGSKMWIFDPATYDCFTWPTGTLVGTEKGRTPLWKLAQRTTHWALTVNKGICSAKRREGPEGRTFPKRRPAAKLIRQQVWYTPAPHRKKYSNCSAGQLLEGPLVSSLGAVIVFNSWLVGHNWFPDCFRLLPIVRPLFPPLLFQCNGRWQLRCLESIFGLFKLFKEKRTISRNQDFLLAPLDIFTTLPNMNHNRTHRLLSMYTNRSGELFPMFTEWLLFCFEIYEILSWKYRNGLEGLFAFSVKYANWFASDFEMERNALWRSASIMPISRLNTIFFGSSINS